ncbi:hypothetical protein SLEP1_g17151 [Rubroshorea leprosula]|uniref:Uncharacterized protein n=1 Tax=Rubroshorea leprosula TaxID=152421 RepID=A0AAV5J3T0_9ROSI|nr:hypothetical protein SLEP1_g17151 [Rubroshorea leprosula]
MIELGAAQNRGDEEKDDRAIQLGVQETNVQDEVRHTDVVASSVGDTLAVMLMGQQHGKEDSDEVAEEEGSVTGGITEKQDEAEVNITGGLEGITSKHLMCDGLEKDERQEVLETKICRENIGNSHNFKIGIMREIEWEKFSKGATGKKATGNGPDVLENELDSSKETHGPTASGISLKAISPAPNDRQIDERTEEGKHVRIEAANSNSFWDNLDYDEGDLPEWARVLEGKKNKKKKQRVKSFQVVYKQSDGLVGFLTQKKKKGNRLVMEKMKQQIIFEADPAGSMANDSINDNNIQNCNKGIRAKSKIKDSEPLWCGIKELGVSMEGDKLLIIRKLKEMEQRDKKRRKKDMATTSTRN